jgi:transposase-like protein
MAEHAPKDAIASRPRQAPRRYTEAERDAALRVLGQCGGNLTRAARRLEMDVSLLWRWRARAAARTGPG